MRYPTPRALTRPPRMNGTFASGCCARASSAPNPRAPILLAGLKPARPRENASVRLARYLAHGGVASRRAAEEIIASGRVAVAGEVVTDPAFDVDGGEEVLL